MSKRASIVILTSVVLVVAATLGGVAFIKRSIPLPATPQPQETSEFIPQKTNPITVENSLPGSSGWRIDHSIGQQSAIEGFTVPVSVNLGGSLKIYVTTTASTYTFRVYRLGWYNGSGGRLVYSSSVIRGINQPKPFIDPAARTVSCDNWRNPVTLAIPPTWISGIYLIKLLSSAGYMRYASFVVRNDAGHSYILFQTSVLTYQAYNAWGGYSLYRGLNNQGTYDPQHRAYIVSFDRPYDRGDGLGDFPLYGEYNLLRWLEKAGYDVSYTTDVDTDMRGAPLLYHRLFIAAGHDEYWSTAMRGNVTAARDSGVSLAFIGGNDLYWHVRLQSSPMGADREVICYKAGHYYANDPAVDPVSSVDPKAATVLWRDLNEPENLLLGEMYGGVVGGAVDATYPLVLSQGAEAFISGTALNVGSTLPGLIGGEYDRVDPHFPTPFSVLVLSSSTLQCSQTSLCPANGTDKANATLYTAKSGAKVFDAGTFFWAWGLDSGSLYPHYPYGNYASPDFEHFMANLVDYLLA